VAVWRRLRSVPVWRSRKVQQPNHYSEREREREREREKERERERETEKDGERTLLISPQEVEDDGNLVKQGTRKFFKQSGLKLK
jgi:hypothetical protein